MKTLRRNLVNADGLDKIFARHMPDRHGKYIVFCSNVTHMNRMISLVPDWFAQIDNAPHIYRAYSPAPKTRAAFTSFREDESEHLKLLFTIDMLNEGIHVADVDGVILFRPTVSPIIYKQQIGRALSAGSTKTPVIFDIVNNIESLSSIGALEREFEEAVLRTGGNERERQELRQRFQIIDEVRDYRQLFEQLNDTLTYTWEDMYERAKEYYEAHGNLRDNPFKAHGITIVQSDNIPREVILMNEDFSQKTSLTIMSGTALASVLYDYSPMKTCLLFRCMQRPPPGTGQLTIPENRIYFLNNY